MRRGRVALIMMAALGAAYAPHARADYVEVRQTAELKRAASRDASTVKKLELGDQLELIGTAQENGYYLVRATGGAQGYVYRTLVRRHLGSLVAGPEQRADLPAMRVHLIDVGQGAATLLEFSCGAVLIDTGGELNSYFNSGDALRAYLDDFFDRRRDLHRTFDLLVVTHPHKDHTANARAVVEAFAVKNVVTDGHTTGSGGDDQRWLEEWATEHAHLETVRASSVPPGGSTNEHIDPLRCADGDPRIVALWGAVDEPPGGWTQDAYHDENNHSVVLRVDWGRASFLLTGDLETDGIREMMSKHGGTGVLDVDVWQVGHHGSANGITRELVDAVTPALALLATGAETRHAMWTAWKYGHPRRDAVSLLNGAVTLPRRAVVEWVAAGPEDFARYRVDKAIYATGWDGSVVVTAQSDGVYRVATEW